MMVLYCIKVTPSKNYQRAADTLELFFLSFVLFAFADCLSTGKVIEVGVGIYRVNSLARTACAGIAKSEGFVAVKARCRSLQRL